tara:strand:+ start:1763 stop:2653 length:891 start_codon:yes stop_codon:yes gene_type:complete
MKKKYVLKGNKITKDLPIIDFDPGDGSFWINKKELNQEDLNTISTLSNRLRWNKDFRFDCTITKVKDMNFGFYDKCMQYYCKQIIDLRYQHKDTCWAKNAEKTVVFKKCRPDFYFKEEDKIEFIGSLKTDTNHHAINKVNATIKREFKSNPIDTVARLVKTYDNWIVFYFKKPLRGPDIKSYAKRMIKDKIKSIINYKSYERVIDIAKNIKERGWLEDLAWNPPGTVLLQSQANDLYQNWTGRHRMSALKYLHDIGEVDDEIAINFPIIKHPFERLTHSVSHPNLEKTNECCKHLN